MARRKHHEEEHENHERWLVSYADFITLLFAFFVVMYSLSSVNEGKYRVLSESLVTAFRSSSLNDSGTRRIVAQPGSGAEAIQLIQPVAPVPRSADPVAQARREAAVARMRNMADEIRRVLDPLAQGGQVRVSEGAHGISVEINASVLFAPGEASIGAAADALRAVAKVLAPADFPITIEGHTDNLPIATARFPSNWELSSARASSVVRLFIEAGVPAARLKAAGYADQRPVADNAREEGRARNRRVTILIESMIAEEDPPAPAPLRPDDPLQAILPDEGVPPLPGAAPAVPPSTPAGQ